MREIEFDTSELDIDSQLIIQSLIDNNRDEFEIIGAIQTLERFAEYIDNTDDRKWNVLLWGANKLRDDDKIKYAELRGYEEPQRDGIQLFNDVLTATRIQRTTITESKLMRDINTGEMINVYDPPFGAQVMHDGYVWTAVRDTRSDYSLFLSLNLFGENAKNVERERIAWSCYENCEELMLRPPTDSKTYHVICLNCGNDVACSYDRYMRDESYSTCHLCHETYIKSLQ